MGGRSALSRRRLVAALLLLLGAFALHVGLAEPARRQRDAARDEFARLRTEREELRARGARVERRLAAARTPSGEAAAVRDLRASLLRATDGLRLGGVQIGADAAGRGPVAASGRLAARGDQASLLRLADRLAEPASGVLVDAVRLSAVRDGEARLEVDAATERGGP